ncbi:MAG TPA: hypothetical protein VKV18_11620 [Chthonomonas sp.]|nr:hypothetical protein [Chthonomonas sp.]
MVKRAGLQWNRFLIFGAVLLLLIVTRVGLAQQATNPFQDVPAGNWAYAALATLQQEGAITGYPTDYFQGKTLRSRYELAVALKRALDRLSVASSATHVTLKDMEPLKRLVVEFEPELKMLGETRAAADASVAAVEASLSHSTSSGSSGPAPSPSLQVTTHVEPQLPLLETPLPSSNAVVGSPSRAVGGASLPTLNLAELGNTLRLANASGPGVALQLSLARAAQLQMQLGDATALDPLLPSSPGALSYMTRLTYRPLSNITLQAEALRNLVPILEGSSYTLLGSNAYRVRVGYANGPASAELGFQFVAPALDNNSLLASSLLLPNSTLLEGPFTSLSLRLSHSLQSYLMGEILMNTNSRDALSELVLNGVYRGQAGVIWDPLPGLHLSAGFESIFYDLSSASGLGGRSLSSQQFITLGAGLNLTRNAMLQLLYQYGNSSSPLLDTSRSTGNSVFTTQLAIHF